jgi:hypothetical protein
VEIREEQLLMRIANTIAPSHSAGRRGVGLHNVRERLAVQFREKASFSVGPDNAGEWVASICMPLLRDGPSARPAPPA